MAASRRSSRRHPKSGGLGRVAQAASRQKGKNKWLRLDDGDMFVLRVLDTGKDFKDAYVHRVPLEKDDGEQYYADVPCLDQDEKGIPCPGCKDDIDRRYKFWTNVLVRDFEDDETGEEKDTVMIWSGGITIAKRLDKLDARHGLRNRDIEVERQGKKMKDTKYEVEWADEEDIPLTEKEEELIKDQRADLARYTAPPEFDDFYVPVSERDRDDEDAGEESVKRGSAFKRRKKQQEEEEDEEPRKTTTRRRSATSKKAKPAGLSGFGKREADGNSVPKKTTVRRRAR